MDRGIGGEDFLDLQPRGVQEIAEGVFVFGGIEAAADGAAFLFIETFPCGKKRVSQFPQEDLGLAGLGLVLVLGRHFTGGDAVMDVGPDRKVARAFRIEIEIHEVEARLGFGVVVAVPAVLLQKIQGLAGRVGVKLGGEEG